MSRQRLKPLYYVLPSCRLQYFRCWHLQLRAEYFVPEPACHSKAILKVCKVMLKMILFELFPVCGKPVAVSEARTVKLDGTYVLWCRK